MEKLKYGWAVISVHQLTKSFRLPGGKSTTAVDALSFEVQAGRVFAVLGPNGSGKTTLLRMLAGLLNPDSGELSVAGLSLPKGGSKVRAKMGFLTGSAALHKKLTPSETLDFFAALHGLGQEEYQLRRVDLVERLGLGDLMGKLVGTLSMGQKQRVMIARALLADPDVVVFDEATSGLDVIAAQEIMKIIAECKAMGKTVIFATHIMGEVSLVADDVMVLNKGKKCFDGTLQELVDAKGERSLEEEFIRLLKEVPA